jgi:hypothetical protein
LCRPMAPFARKTYYAIDLFAWISPETLKPLEITNTPGASIHVYIHLRDNLDKEGTSMASIHLKWMILS